MNLRTGTTKVATPARSAEVFPFGAPRWAVIRHLETGNVIAEHEVASRDDATLLLECYAGVWPEHPMYVELRVRRPTDGAPDPVPERVATGLQLRRSDVARVGGATR